MKGAHSHQLISRAGKPSLQVVTLIKNNQSYSTTNLRSCFARVLPTQHQPTATRVVMVSLRARYYDTKTGEFGSPDPREYVDGLSLFRIYVGVGGMDPLGLAMLDVQGNLPDPAVWYWNHPFLNKPHKFKVTQGKDFGLIESSPRSSKAGRPLLDDSYQAGSF